MIFRQLAPNDALRSIVECYWIVENDDPTVGRQKIIPDGYPELIFHYGEPYRINLSGSWERQTLDLLAGQISRYFYLENTGRSGMIGVKLFPTTLRQLVGISMHTLTDAVIDLNSLETAFGGIGDLVRKEKSAEEWIRVIECAFMDLISDQASFPVIDDVVRAIIQNKGVDPVSDLVERFEVSERKLERLFWEYVGLSPKLYSRVIRFSEIFPVEAAGIEYLGGPGL